MIEVEGLTKRYRSATAVDNLTFSVRPGIVTGFLGPNGAGKSTTMRMIVGLDRPTAGTATIDGAPYRALSKPLTRVGCLLDSTWVHTRRSARNHLAMQARAGGFRARRADEVLELVGLSSVAKKAVGSFSLGMRQRLGLASAMLGDPEVLVLDEPANGLDPEGIHWIRQFMTDRAAEGRTVFVSSHLLGEVAAVATDVVIIGKGRLRAATTIEEFTSASAQVVLRTPHGNEFWNGAQEEGLDVAFDAERREFTISGTDTDTVGDLAASLGVTVHELRVERSSLEDAYFELTGDDVEYPSAASGAARKGR